MLVTKDLAADASVVFICDDQNNQYAQIVSGNLSATTVGTLPQGFTYIEKAKFNVVMEYTLDDDKDILDGNGVAYWGVEARRRK